MPYKDKQKQRDYQKRWIAKRRSDFFNGKSCVLCGSGESLELDHIIEADKTCHKIWSWAKVRRELEIQKCQVLCKVCHLVKTSKYNSIINRKVV